MYADRHARSSAIDPRSLGIAVALNGAALAALLLARPAMITVDRPKPPLTTYAVPLQPPPEPLPPPPAPHPETQHQPTPAPKPKVELPRSSDQTVDVDQPKPTPTGDPGPTSTPTATATAEPVTIGPAIDPAHRGDLQPVYPAGELRAEHEGMVTVRVLIGSDGRVRRIERVAATSDAFFRATEERALARWRFRPAMRDGVPIEAWRTMTIRFVIPR